MADYEKTINIDIKGLPELVSKLKSFPTLIRPLMAKALEKAMTEIEGQSKMNTPVDTGFLRNSWNSFYSPMRAEGGPTAYYGIYVHEGTRKMKGRPFLASAIESRQKAVDRCFDEALEQAIKVIAK